MENIDLDRFDPDLVQQIENMRRTIGHAAAGRNDGAGRRQYILVKSIYQQRYVRRTGRRQQYLFRSGQLVKLRPLSAGKTPRTLQHDVNFQLLPRKLRRILLPKDPKLPVVYRKLAVCINNREWQGSVYE